MLLLDAVRSNVGGIPRPGLLGAGAGGAVAWGAADAAAADVTVPATPPPDLDPVVVVVVAANAKKLAARHGDPRRAGHAMFWK